MYKKYPNYIDSNIQWINEIPKEWQLIKAKWLFKEKTIKGYPSETLLSVSKGRGLLPRDQLEFKAVMAFKDLENFKLVAPNDFVIHLRSFQSGFELSKVKGIVSPAYTVFYGKDLVYPDFYKYIFYSRGFIDYIAATTQSLRDGKPIAYNTFGDMDLPLPSYKEQIKIAEFLNFKTQSIDSVVEGKEKLINLLAEKCHSLITEAVTKGLNLVVKMKDSGVEWIGEIPNEWKVAKLKYFSHRIGEGLHGTPIYADNGEIYFINGNNLGLKEIRLTESTNKISLEESMKYKQTIGSNTILISLNGTIGKLSLYNEESIMLSKSAGFINLKECINKEFIYYFLKSRIVKNFYEQSFAGTTINNLSLETLRNTPLLVPSIEEQKEIVSYLNTLELEFKKVLSDLHLQIQKLKDYRQSLIYEAVTGKIDVRDIEIES